MSLFLPNTTISWPACAIMTAVAGIFVWDLFGCYFCDFDHDIYLAVTKLHCSVLNYLNVNKDGRSSTLLQITPNHYVCESVVIALNVTYMTYTYIHFQELKSVLYKTCNDSEKFLLVSLLNRKLISLKGTVCTVSIFYQKICQLSEYNKMSQVFSKKSFICTTHKFLLRKMLVFSWLSKEKSP